MTNLEYAANLRLLANFYEQNDSFPLPYDYHRFRFLVEGKAGMEAFARSAPKPIEKRSDDTFYRLHSRVGGFLLEAYDWHKNVCEKMSLGTRTRIEKIPTAFEEKEVTEEVFEWRCPESILNAEAV